MFQPLNRGEWTAKWRWPVGTRVSVPTQDGRLAAVVTKENPTTVWLRFDDGTERRNVPMALLTREGGDL